MIKEREVKNAMDVKDELRRLTTGAILNTALAFLVFFLSVSGRCIDRLSVCVKRRFVLCPSTGLVKQLISMASFTLFLLSINRHLTVLYVQFLLIENHVITDKLRKGGLEL